MSARILFAVLLLLPGLAGATGNGGVITPIDTRPNARPVLPVEARRAPVLVAPGVVQAPVDTARKQEPMKTHDVLTTPQGRPETPVPQAQPLPDLLQGGPPAPPVPDTRPPVTTVPKLPTAAQVPGSVPVQEGAPRPETKP